MVFRSTKNLKNIMDNTVQATIFSLKVLIGELLQASFTESITLKIIGKNGVLHVRDLRANEIENLVNKGDH